MVERLIGSGKLVNCFFDNLSGLLKQVGTLEFRKTVTNRVSSSVLQTLLAEVVERFRGVR